jgi:DNA-directed RNA polymerase subunit F
MFNDREIAGRRPKGFKLSKMQNREDNKMADLYPISWLELEAFYASKKYRILDEDDFSI